MPKLRSCVLVVSLLAAGGAGAAAPLTDRQEDAGKLGDTLQYAVPLTAFALTFLLDAREESEPFSFNFDTDKWLHLDGSPRHDFALAAGRAVVLTQGLKYAFNETRPNGGTHSFPSGHTSIAFMGAEFIRKEYGWLWGIPAYLGAGYVGWSRVESREHYTRDVLAGAAIGILVNHDFREFHTRYGLLSFQSVPVVTQGRSLPGLQLKLAF
jgi:hypothetical protein